MTFKPHFGICVCHGLKRLIVLKSGICKQKNDEIKKEKRSKRLEGSVGGNVKSNSQGNDGERTGNDDDRPKYKSKFKSRFKNNGAKRNGSSIQSRGASKNKRKQRPISKKRNSTGELILFKEIYEERGPYSQISGEYVEFNVWCFSHILPKGNYSRFRLDKRNIIIKTPQEHHAWHTETHKLKLLPEWKWVFELYEQLKIEYNETGRTKS